MLQDIDFSTSEQSTRKQSRRRCGPRVKVQQRIKIWPSSGNTYWSCGQTVRVPKCYVSVPATLRRSLVSRKRVFLLQEKSRQYSTTLDWLAHPDDVENARQRKANSDARAAEAVLRANTPAAIARREAREQRKQAEEKIRLAARREADLETLQASIEAHACRLGCSVDDLEPQLRLLREHPHSLQREFVENLRDLRDAHPDWLGKAVAAVISNRFLNGRATKWFMAGEIDFRRYVGICIHVARRHEETNYDELLSMGWDRETARILTEC